jgi:uncharacterized alkaline shock family protein YloU
MNYYVNGSKTKGQTAISNYVFTQIAEDTIASLMEGELKDKISLKNGRKKCKILADVDKKNNVTVVIEIVAIAGTKPAQSVSLIQKAVYDAIYDATEISTIKVNVSLLGVADK